MSEEFKFRRIRIQPLGYVNRKIIDYLQAELSGIFGSAKILKPLEINRRCFDSIRRRYISTCLLRSYEVDGTTLFVTEHDLFADNLNFVFGEAELGGMRAIISLFRLKPELYGEKNDDLFRERALKEAVHELGHVFGLKHCNNIFCVMRFSNSIIEVDLKDWRFCSFCLGVLERKGILVKQ
jgi:archaemetzincin